jgi:hypothetical protein
MSYDNQVSALTAAYAVGASDYESTVHALVDAYTTRRISDDSMSPILSLLGCRNVRCLPFSTQKQLEAPAQPDEIHEAFVSQTLQTLLHLHMQNNAGADQNNAFAILDGLARNNRWRACLDEIHVANDLAVLLVEASLTLGSVTPNERSTLYQLVRACTTVLYGLLNEWLEPAKPFVPGALMTEVARAIFGDIWYDLTFGDEPWMGWPANNDYNTMNLFIVASIHRNPPPFRPSLLNASAEKWVDLPGLEST